MGHSYNGGVRGKRGTNHDSATRSGLFGVNEAHIGRTENKWQQFKGESSDNPAASADEVYSSSGNSASSGLYYIKANGVDTDLAWCELNYQGTGRSYVLIFAATNLYGDTQSWWKGQYMNSTVFENSDGTSHASWTSRTKKNLKLETWNHYSWNELLIIEDFEGDESWKSYKHDSIQTMNYYLGGTTTRGWYNRDSDMITGGTNRKAFTSDQIKYNNSLSNDGGRLVPDNPSNECSGGFNTHVDDGTGYVWKGNITRNDGNRHYNSDVTTGNHTCWFLGRTYT